jgi:hypothetical protein
MQPLVVGGVARSFPRGLTLVIDVTGKVRFVIASSPYESRTQNLDNMALSATTNALGWPVDDPLADPFAVDYHGMHEARS